MYNNITTDEIYLPINPITSKITDGARSCYLCGSSGPTHTLTHCLIGLSNQISVLHSYIDEIEKKTGITLERSPFEYK